MTSRIDSNVESLMCIVTACVLLALVMLLAGCGRTMQTAKAPEPVPPAEYLQPVTAKWAGDTLIAQSHTSADGLVANLENRLPRGAGILAATFVNQDNFDETSSLGRMLSTHVVTRLAQAGFGVMEVRLRGEMGVRVREGEFALSRKTAQYMNSNFEAFAMLVGVYTVDEDAVFVSSRVVRLDTGHVLAAYDYAVPRKGPVERLVDMDGDVDFDGYMRKRNVGAMADAGPQAFAPLQLQEIPLEIPAAPGAGGAPVEIPGPTEEPGPFRLFPPTNLQ